MDLTPRQRLVFSAYEVLSGQRPLTEFRRLERLQWESPAIIVNQLDEQLRRMVKHAARRVEHYRVRFAEAGLRPEQIQRAADLARLPPTTRAEVRQGFPSRFLAAGVPAGRRLARTTSGSTGMPLSFAEDRRAESRRLAAYLLARSWAGTRLGDTMIYIASPDHLYAGVGYASRRRKRAREVLLGERIHHLSGLHFKVSDVQSIVDAMPNGGRYFLWGFPSYLSWLAKGLQANGGPGRTPEVVVSYGETLSEVEAEHLAAVFLAPVVNHYSLWEMPHLAQSCPDQPGQLHLLGDRAIVRIARPDGTDAEVDEIGRVLVTNLTNEVMPLINYETGDLAARGRPCPCGRGLPTLEAVHGRFSELITTSAGRVLSPVTLGNRLAFTLHAERYLWEYQLVQVEPDRLVLRVVPTSQYSAATEALLVTSLTALFEGEMRVEIETVDRIVHEPSGKRLLTKVEPRTNQVSGSDDADSESSA